MRIEHDSLGEVEVPADALWGAQTARAVANFPISGLTMPLPILHALAQVKSAAARANVELDSLDPDVGRAIVAAADEVARGLHDDQFPVDVFQTGSGTSTNMNMNEVVARIAKRASGLDIHPNDHVNAGQSSNDTFPTAIRVAAVLATRDLLEPALRHLSQALRGRQSAFASVVKAGRTHLMDAVPVTLGQEFGGYRRQIDLARERLLEAADRAAELPLGGTAVGTGLNATPGFASGVIARLNRATDGEFREAWDHFEAQSSQDALVALSGAATVLAVSLTKICNDLRWMGSGPRTGLGEIHLPELQPGSSIMPGKVNPVVPEAVLMVCAQVIGNNATITTAGAAGNFELNVMLPVIGRNLLESLTFLASACRLLADRCVDGITADEQRCLDLARSSPAIVTPLSRYLGYEAAAEIVQQSVRDGRPIRDIVIDRGHLEAGDLTLAQLDKALDLLAMTRPTSGR
ncbi:MAG TPA: class II fumarate hydratase [Dermatophilaceae bacterium]|nr:class II fumarate hydratase [Dermatophilaceae bacterium]